MRRVISIISCRHDILCTFCAVTGSVSLVLLNIVSQLHADERRGSLMKRIQMQNASVSRV